MITVRQATEDDAETIRDIFTTTYHGQYAHREFFDTHQIKKLIFDDDVLVLVAENSETGEALGTGSVILDIGAFGDLMGEFGRLAVIPQARGEGVGGRLMEERLARIEDRLHIAIVENRAVHPFSQKISAKYGFFPVGFLPSKLRFADRENVALYARHFGDCLELRKNHPRIIPEAYPLADAVMQGAGLPTDVIVDDHTPAYAQTDSFDLDSLTSKGYTSLLHFERGRIGRREIFGPVKLHAGLFQLRVRDYEYLLARRNGHLVGGIGYHIDPADEAARILELVSADDKPVRFLLEEVVRICREDAGVKYIEVDVNAHAPAMQRSLLELGFLPAAFIPAMAFHRVERLDVIRMVRLFPELKIGKVALHETTQPVADVVIATFESRKIDPRIAAAVSGTSLFKGLTEEQSERLAALCDLDHFEEGQRMTTEGETDGRAFLILEGRAGVAVGSSENVGTIGPGEIAGELSLMHGQPHHATLTAAAKTEAAVLNHDAVETLVRQRPDIGVILNRNLADGLGEKLMRREV